MSDDAHRDARESYEAGDFKRSRQVSLTGLEINADDLELLRIAGKASVELAATDAVGLLQKVVALDPDDAQGWHDLGEALAAEGRVREAADAFHKAVEALERAVALRPDDTATIRSLVGIYRGAGRIDDALGVAERLADADPDDVLALIEVADLSLALDRLDRAAAAYERIRDADDEPEHEVYALHGLLQVELRREDWARAHEL